MVRRHLETVSRKPVAAHNAAAFNRLLDAVTLNPRPLILDSFCGTGHSTAELARRHPDHLVVGIDKSLDRLSRHPASEAGNYLLLRAECEDIWRLLVEAGLAVDYHYLLYPNPWPKAKHLQRRVHGNASFAWLVKLAGAGSGKKNEPGRIELRSNWQTYVEEFGVAMHLAGALGRVSLVSPAPALTLFELKYRESGHALWRYIGAAAALTQ